MLKMKREYTDENAKRIKESDYATGQYLCVYCGKEIHWNPFQGHPECTNCKTKNAEMWEAKRQRALARSRAVGGDDHSQPDMW